MLVCGGTVEDLELLGRRVMRRRGCRRIRRLQLLCRGRFAGVEGRVWDRPWRLLRRRICGGT